MKKRLVVFVQLLPAIVSLLVLGAHFLRSGSIILFFLTVALTFGLFIREPFMARVTQVALILATIEWGRYAIVFVSARMEAGQPWQRLAIIIGVVGLVSFASIFVFRTQAIKSMYHLDTDESVAASKRQSEEPGETNGMGRETVSVPASKEFMEVHKHKIILNALSPLAFLLMDFFMVGGVFALVGIGFANNSLRRKMNRIGGELALNQKKTNFLRQTILMLGVSLAIMLYFYLTMPTPITQKITMSVVAAYAVFICLVGYLEYNHKEQVC